MTSYRLSEDAKRLAIVTRKGTERDAAAKKVNIVNYRDRFAKVREVPRQTADDAVPEQTVSIYLFELDDLLHEKGELTRIFSRKMTGPRDVVGTPNWSLDSERVVFAVFDQTGQRTERPRDRLQGRREEEGERREKKEPRRGGGSQGWRGRKAGGTGRGEDGPARETRPESSGTEDQGTGGKVGPSPAAHRRTEHAENGAAAVSGR